MMKSDRRYVIFPALPIQGVWEYFICDMIAPKCDGNGFVNIFCHNKSIINPKMKKINGYLEVIAGPMFCGKTEELIRQVRRAAIAKKHIQVFKHAIDIRYGNDKKLFSHAGLSFASDVVTTPKQILKKIHPKTEIIAIDEAQWFGPGLVPVVDVLLKKGKKVLVAGLALTYDREPFAPIPTLMTMADRVTKLSAICAICGEEAVYHKRITGSKNIDPHVADPSLVGKLDTYQPRCRRCYPKSFTSRRRKDLRSRSASAKE